MKITAQDAIINLLITAMDETLYGKGVAMKCDVKYSHNGKNATLEINPKHGQTMSEQEWMWLGYYARECMD